MNGIHPGYDEATYHADPAFSQSAAKVLLESPARYRWRLENPEPPRDEFDVGHAVHAKVLGVGLPIVEIPADLLSSNGAVSTKAAKEFVATARAAGEVPLLGSVIATVDRMAEAVLAHTAARGAFEAEGDVELSMWWTDPDSGVEARGRIDKAAATSAGISLVDLKTTADGSPRAFASSAAKFGYRLQGGAYCDGWEQITGDQPAGFLFVTVEKEAPHLVGTYSLAPLDVEEGRDKWRLACARLADYRARDEWPSYADEPEPFAHLYLPAWAV
jgi:hypothetical protein